MVEAYQTSMLPNLESSLKDIETLFTQGAADLLKVIAVRRNLLTARSSYLDALYELRQAGNDLALAVADPALTIEPQPSEPAQ
jgi:outer membrane protein TolC